MIDPDDNDDDYVPKVLDRVFDLMADESNETVIRVGCILLAAALDAAPPSFRNEAGNIIKRAVSELVAKRRI